MRAKTSWALTGMLALAGMATGSNAAPQEAFCSCDNEYQVGQVVHVTVDSPNRAPNLPAGSNGKVLCGNPDFNGWIQVGFLDWNNGNRDLNNFCACGEPDLDARGWWVKCNDLKAGWAPVRGACCIDGQCQGLFEPECDRLGGEYLGDGTPCDDRACGCGVPVECPDLDGNGVVDVDDVYEFVFRWIGRVDAPVPDLNADCELDIRDLVLIIDAIGPCMNMQPNMGDAPEPEPEPEPTGACCTGDECAIQVEADCQGDWLGEDSTCEQIDCRVRAVSNEELCQCEGQFRAGDRVTLLMDNPGRAGAVQNHGRPELLRGARGVVLCADASGWDRVAVAWEGFRDHDNPGEIPRRDATFLCDCGIYSGHGMQELGIHRLETWTVDCENLLPGWRELDEVGACCLGEFCQPLPEADCLDRGGDWGGDRVRCDAENCGGEVLCGCDEQFAVGDRVELLVNRPLDDEDLDRGDHGIVICTWEHEVLGDMLLVRWWFHQGGAAHPALIENCQCGWRDPIQPHYLQVVQCHHVEVRPE
ncbi:MAG: hypothetical protein P8K80_06685 [Phycisphaerales bacterium]|nr:hypothetical protein [Phycisphaerales bacterium]